jgi:hypothetical protein
VTVAADELARLARSFSPVALTTRILLLTGTEAKKQSDGRRALASRGRGLITRVYGNHNIKLLKGNYFGARPEQINVASRI